MARAVVGKVLIDPRSPEEQTAGNAAVAEVDADLVVAGNSRDLRCSRQNHNRMTVAAVV